MFNVMNIGVPTEAVLRRKVKRYKKHIKALERAVQWRNEVINELSHTDNIGEEYVNM